MEIPVKEIANDELQALGFAKKGLHWYKPYPDVIHVVEFRKSRWGQYYTVNLAVWVREFGPDEHPKSRECQLQVAIGRVEGCPPKIDAALNEEEYWTIDADQRREIIKLALCNAEFSFFQELTSFEKVKRFVKKRPRMNLALTKSLAERFDINRQ